MNEDIYNDKPISKRRTSRSSSAKKLYDDHKIRQDKNS